MLRAYSYTDSGLLDTDIIDKAIQDKERRIILDFVGQNPTPKRETPCVVCGGDTDEFDVIDGVYFQRCRACYSIFAPVERAVINRYLNYPPLIEFRNSVEYQENAARRRVGIWDELLFWLEYRLARYLGKSAGVDIIDVSNRYAALSEKISGADFCGAYNATEQADAVLYFDHFRCQCDPMAVLSELRGKLRQGGLLVMNMRVGSGFDVLALRAGAGLLPYETILLPSTGGMDIMLKNAGFELLEISTPGTLDALHVLQNKENIDERDLFIRYLIDKTEDAALAEFQRFLQKYGMSSHARIIARKA